MAAPFRLYNTLTRTVEDFAPIEPGRIRLYVCGMTVYDEVHVGHARAMVVFDTFVRCMRRRGWEITFVRNFTDVDDKIIQRAAGQGVDPGALAQTYIDHFHRDMDALGLLRPDHEPRVTTSMDSIQAMIGALLSRGHAYEADGSVLFSVRSFQPYGALSNQDIDHLKPDDADHGKRDASDFALWKAVKPGEPSWPSPWGRGRPGWHIECSAMAHECLGNEIDIHGGGLDLVFPHHENEIAQSEAATGCRYARCWMHNGMLTMPSGHKMGKSEGNAFNVHDILAIYPAEAVRLYYLQTHYRSPLPWTPNSLNEVLTMLARLYEARAIAQQMGGDEEPGKVCHALGSDAQQVMDLGASLEANVENALSDDFNTAKALGFLFEVARAINRLSNHKQATQRAGPVVANALRAMTAAAHTMHLLNMDYDVFEEEVKAKRLPSTGLTKEEVDAIVLERVQARASKDWARADAIRDQLEASGIAIMDRPSGPVWRIRLG